MFKLLNRSIALSTAFILSMAIMLAQGPAAPTSVHVQAGLTSVTCDQTFSTGNNAAIVTAVGQNTGTTRTLCLNSGNYGTLNLANITRTALVTIRSVTGVGALVSPQINNVDFVKFDSVSPTNVNLSGCSTHIEFWNSTWQQNNMGVFINEGSCSAQNLIFDNNIFRNLQLTWADERFGTEGGVNGLIIRNNLFENTVGCTPSGCASGGIHLGGGTNIVIGPHNIFRRMTQATCSADTGQHCDAIQCFGCGSGLVVKQNLFELMGDGVCLGFYDGLSNLTVTNNIFNGCDRNIQGGSIITASIKHNTFKNGSVEWSSDSGSPANSNIVIEDNILDNEAWTDSQGNYCGVGCIQRYNLLSRGSTMAGSGCTTGCVTGNATYLGGSTTPPSTWAGWQLAGDSPGLAAGNDGLDMGSTDYGP